MQVLFAIFLVLSLATHSGHWRVGPFTWLPVLRLPALIPVLVLSTADQTPMSIGVLTLVPVLLALSWPALRLLELRQPERRRRWQWGWLHISGPLFGLTLLGIASLVLAGLLGQNLAVQPQAPDCRCATRPSNCCRWVSCGSSICSSSTSDHSSPGHWRWSC